LILHVFIKNPRPGYVKTRLAATVGDTKALAIYHYLLAQTRSAALDCTAQRWLWYSDALQEQDEWPSAQFTKKVQAQGDLGQRMRYAFQTAFDQGAERSVIIGSDCPELTGALLGEAFDALQHCDTVLGPTFDGGYYLLGMKRLHGDLFENIDWSTERVLPQTMDKIRSAALTLHLLPTLNDIDQEADWNAYQSKQTGQLLP
jgi:rSAM/selenodomain-associated transferase 1